MQQFNWDICKFWLPSVWRELKTIGLKIKYVP